MALDYPILIVEDQPAEARGLEELLSALGHRAVVAHSAPEAWDRLEDGELFSLVLLDLRMPDIDGAEFNLALRHNFPHLRVIFVTGFPVPDEDAQLAFSVLRKPVTGRALAGEIARAAAAG